MDIQSAKSKKEGEKKKSKALIAAMPSPIDDDEDSEGASYEASNDEASVSQRKKVGRPPKTAQAIDVAKAAAAAAATSFSNPTSAGEKRQSSEGDDNEGKKAKKGRTATDVPKKSEGGRRLRHVRKENAEEEMEESKYEFVVPDGFTPVRDGVKMMTMCGERIAHAFSVGRGKKTELMWFFGRVLQATLIGKDDDPAQHVEYAVQFADGDKQTGLLLDKKNYYYGEVPRSDADWYSFVKET